MHDHHHAHTHHDTSLKILFFSIAMIVIYAVVEMMGGLYAHSLALLSDAGHMISDACALGITALAAWIAKKPPSPTHSYGMGRAEILAAWLSSVIMLLIAIFIVIEAIERIHAPVNVAATPLMIIAFLGMLVNVLIARILMKTKRTLNIRAALLHVFSDLLGSLAAFIAGVVIYFTHWFPIDPILSMVIGLLIAIGSIRLLRESIRILMEGVPLHIDLQTVTNELKKISGVLQIHDLHIWTLSSGHVALSAHVNIHEISSWETILKNLSRTLAKQFDIHHVTLQPEADVFDCKPCRTNTA